MVYWDNYIHRPIHLLQHTVTQSKMATNKINNPMKEQVKINVGMDPNYGAGSPMKLMRKAQIHVCEGTEIEIWFNNKVIYERRFGNQTIPHDILVEVKDVQPYPNCNFWVDDRFILPGNGIQYMQEIEVRTNAPFINIFENTFMDK